MNRLKTPNFYADAAKKEWDLDNGICNYGYWQKEFESMRYVMNEMRKDAMGENLDTKNLSDVAEFVADNTIHTIEKGHKKLLGKKKHDKLVRVMSRKLPRVSKLLGVLDMKGKIDDFLKLEELFVNLFQRNDTIDNICKPKPPEKMRKDVKDFLEKFQKEPRINYDYVKPPRLNEPGFDNGNNGTIVA